MKPDNGGPAFPDVEQFAILRSTLTPAQEPIKEIVYQRCRGMSLRDYFAAAALSAIVSGWYAGKRVGTSLGDHEGIADCAYQLADAMIAERDKMEQGNE